MRGDWPVFGAASGTCGQDHLIVDRKLPDREGYRPAIIDAVTGVTQGHGPIPGTLRGLLQVTS